MCHGEIRGPPNAVSHRRTTDSLETRMTYYQRWVCECCYLKLASDDTSSCEHCYFHTEWNHPVGLMGGLNGLDVVPADERPEIPMRSFRECDGCAGVVEAMGILHEVHIFE